MSKRKYLWRVTAHYSQDIPPHEWTTVRHYQSLGAAVVRAQQLREGYPVGGHLPADRVDIERSAAVDGWTAVQP